MAPKEGQPVSLDEFLKSPNGDYITRVQVSKLHYKVDPTQKGQRIVVGKDTRTVVLPPDLR